MLPSMPVLFQRDSQSGDNFTFKQSPLAIFAEPPVPKPLSSPLKPKAYGARRKQDEPPEPTPDEENQQEINYVQQYYNKICKLPVEKFTKFKDILTNFSAGQESPVLLYQQLESLLGEDELVEEFLTFLTPGQASKVGRLMDHLALTKIYKFIHNLQTALARKPAKLRKVIKAVTTVAASGSESDLRQKVEPLIRTHARLLQQFRTLFPSERPPESLYALEHTEEFPESAWASDGGYHRIEMEEEPAKHHKGDADVTYLHGRVFIRQGRVLRPASVTFPGSCLQEHIDRLAPPRDQLLLLPGTTTTTVHSDDDSRKKSLKRQRASAKTRKDKNKSPERSAKTPNDVSKRTIKAASNARSEKTTAKRDEKEEAKCRRKREHSPDDEGTKKKQSRRPDAKKTERDETKDVKRSKTVFDKRKGKTKVKSDGDRKSQYSPSRSQRRDRKCSVSKSDSKSKSIDDKCNKNVKDNKIERDSEEVDKELTEIMKTYEVHVNSGKQTDVTTSSQQTDNTKETEITESSQNDNRDIDSDNDQNQLQNQQETQNCTLEQNPKCSWTRSEDKTILLVLKAGPECEDTFLKMRELLPHRSLQELRERFVHVMDLLRSMALGELT